MEDVEEPSDWRLWVAEKIGAIREMARTNRERILTLEDEVGVDPPDTEPDIERRLNEIEQAVQQQPPTGFWSWLYSTTSSTYRTVATIVLGIIAALLLTYLAASDVPVPFVGGRQWLLLWCPSVLRGFGGDDVNEPDDREASQSQKGGTGQFDTAESFGVAWLVRRIDALTLKIRTAARRVNVADRLGCFLSERVELMLTSQSKGLEVFLELPEVVFGLPVCGSLLPKPNNAFGGRVRQRQRRVVSFRCP